MFVQEFLDLGIEPKGNSEEQKVKCPKCKSLGKENWKDTCLSINTLMGVYNCHKCGYKGTVRKMEQYTKPMKQYTKPSKTNMKRISDRGRKYLKGRGITDEVIERNKIVSSSDDRNIFFPYMKNGELLNYKKRGFNIK